MLPKVIPKVILKMIPKVAPKVAPKGGTQGGTQEEILDKWIENQIRENPQITTEELAKMSKKGLRTIKRHIAKMPHIRYVGSGYSGHWEVLDKE